MSNQCLNPKSKAVQQCTLPPDINKIKQESENSLERICRECFASCQPPHEVLVFPQSSAAPKCPTKKASVKPKCPVVISSVGPSKNTKNTPINCARPGVLTRNPFLNYLRYLRTLRCGVPMKQIAIDGGKCWNAMLDKEKWPYIVEAYRTMKRQRSSYHVNVGKRKRKSSRLANKRKSSRCG